LCLSFAVRVSSLRLLFLSKICNLYLSLAKPLLSSQGKTAASKAPLPQGKKKRKGTSLLLLLINQTYITNR